MSRWTGVFGKVKMIRRSNPELAPGIERCAQDPVGRETVGRAKNFDRLRFGVDPGERGRLGHGPDSAIWRFAEPADVAGQACLPGPGLVSTVRAEAYDAK